MKIRKRFAVIVAVLLTVTFSMLLVACDEPKKPTEQASGIREGDIVRTVEDNIFKLAFDGLTVTKVGEQIELLKSVHIKNIQPIEMLTYKSTLIVFYYKLIAPISDNSGAEKASAAEPAQKEEKRLYIEFYDIKDGKSVAVLKPTRTTKIFWQYMESRISGDTLYFFINAAHNYCADKEFFLEDSLIAGEKSSAIVKADAGEKSSASVQPPARTKSGAATQPGAGDKIKNDGTSLVLALDLADLAASEYTVNEDCDNADVAYFGEEEIFVASTQYKMVQNSCDMPSKPVPSSTIITRLEAKSLKTAATSSLNYLVYNRRNLHFNNGYLFLVTPQSPTLIVLDKNFNEVSRLSDLAKGEAVKSVVFNGDFCYITTFKEVDPLFRIDISDPLKPEMLGALKMDGVPKNIIKLSQSRLLGLGKNELSNTVLVNLYDILNDEVTLLDTLELKEYLANEFTFDKRAYALADGVLVFSANSLEGNNCAVKVKVDIQSEGVKKDTLLFDGFYTAKQELITLKKSTAVEEYFAFKRFKIIEGAVYLMSDAQIVKMDGDFIAEQILDTRLKTYQVVFEYSATISGVLPTDEPSVVKKEVLHRVKYGEAIPLPPILPPESTLIGWILEKTFFKGDDLLKYYVGEDMIFKAKQEKSAA